MPEQRFPDLWSSPFFWFISVGIAVFKAATIPERSRASMAMSTLAALFSAMAFSAPAVAYFKVAGTALEYGVVALVALTGEHAMQLVVTLVREPTKAIDLWHKFRGTRDAK